MNTKNSDTDNKKQGHSHAKHMWMMAICCGLPIMGFIAIGVIGISMPSLETLLLLICPIGMIGMMYMMHRDGQGQEKGKACCDSEKADDDPVTGVTYEDNENAKPLVKPKNAGSLEA